MIGVQWGHAVTHPHPLKGRSWKMWLSPHWAQGARCSEHHADKMMLFGTVFCGATATLVH